MVNPSNNSANSPENITAATEADSFSSRINSVSLTKKERIVAQYLLDNQATVGFMTASGIARALDISDVTVIRFARKMGYSGFHDLRAALQHKMIERLSTDKGPVAPQNRLDKTLESAKDTNFVKLAVEAMYDNIAVMTSKNKAEVYEDAAVLLNGSKRKLVVGFRGLASCAESFCFRLSYLVDDVYLTTHTDPGDYSRVYSLTKDDCLIAIGFSEYPSALISLVKQAKLNGAKIITFTENETSPLAHYSDVSIFCGVRGIAFNSFASVFLGMEIVFAHLIEILGSAGAARTQRLLDHMKKTNYFWDYKNN